MCKRITSSCISSSGSLLLSLINDILDLSKLQAGQMVFTPEEIDFRAVATEVCTVFRQKLEEKNLKLNISPEPIPVLYLDKIRVRQIFFNILGNAVKYTNRGSISLKTSFSKDTKDTGTLVLSRQDTGVGISKEDQKTLFQPYVQAKAVRGTKLANNGTGLGLTLWDEWMRANGGNDHPGRANWRKVPLSL